MTYYFTIYRETWLNKGLFFGLILGPVLIGIAEIAGWF
jgi:hypothetical protein